MTEAETQQDDVRRVSALELFFDLVFVFAITRTTELIGDDATWTGLLHGLLVLAVVWWAWGGYAWLTNEVDTERDAVRLSILAAMAAMLLVALAIPGAYDGDGTLFVVAYLCVRLVHVAVYAQAHGRGTGRRGIYRLLPSITVACALLLAASGSDGTAQTLLWLAAVAADNLGLFMSGTSDWRVQPAHFAERHSLIILIALGESVVDIGAGVHEEPIGISVILAALLAIAAIAALWWAYFDVVAPVAERRMRAAAPEERVRIARDSYTFLHLPMVAGIVLLAAGIKAAISDVGEPLTTIAAVELCGGPALYLVAHILFRLRNVHSLNRQRVVASAVLLALIGVATAVPGLTALALVAAVLVGLILYEALRFREARARIRSGGGSMRFSSSS